MISLRTNLPILVALLVLANAPIAYAKSGQLEYLLDLRVYENRVDGCTDCGCRLSVAIDADSPVDFWVVFGLVKPGENSDWAAGSSYSYCGEGSFENVAEDFQSTVGVPYSIGSLTVAAGGADRKGLAMQTYLQRKTFTALDRRGRPDYEVVSLQRDHAVTDGDELVMSLLTPGAETRADLHVHEVLLGLRVSHWSYEDSVPFGAIRIRSNVPGAGVYLDGGLAGRISANKDLELRNIPEGRHQVTVTDFSGRRASQTVRVKKKRVVEADLYPFALESPETGDGLLHIGPNPQGFEEYWRTRDEAIMVSIPAGPFPMGSPEGVGDPNERPRREIDLPAFLIDKHEVTVRQFEAFVDSEYRPAPRTPVWGKHDHFPISFVLWEEADAYCEWAGGRLPSEAEWEKAARGTEGFVYPWGDQWDATRCNSITGGMHRPENVGAYPRCLSPYGVLDMAGSVLEWTANWYALYDTPDIPVDSGSETTPHLRVMRGGAWMNQPGWLRTAYRHPRSPRSRNMDHGFRCALDVAGGSS